MESSSSTQDTLYAGVESLILLKITSQLHVSKGLETEHYPEGLIPKLRFCLCSDAFAHYIQGLEYKYVQQSLNKSIAFLSWRILLTFDRPTGTTADTIDENPPGPLVFFRGVLYSICNCGKKSTNKLIDNLVAIKLDLESLNNSPKPVQYVDVQPEDSILDSSIQQLDATEHHIYAVTGKP